MPAARRAEAACPRWYIPCSRAWLSISPTVFSKPVPVVVVEAMSADGLAVVRNPNEAVELRHPACDDASRLISSLRDARRITDSTTISRLDLNRDSFVAATEHLIQQPPT